MTAGTWAGLIATAVVPVVVVGAGVIYRAGRVTSAVDELARRVSSLEDHVRRRRGE